jgi:hypothetical protein
VVEGIGVPLDPLAGAGPASVVVFYARDAEAFAVLAADTRRVCGLNGQVRLDRHLLGRGTDTAVVTDPGRLRSSTGRSGG